METKAKMHVNGMRNKVQYEAKAEGNGIHRVMHVVIVGCHYPLPLLHTAPCFSCHISLSLSPYSTLVYILSSLHPLKF